MVNLMAEDRVTWFGWALHCVQNQELFVCYNIKIIFDLSFFPCISGRRVDGLWAWLFSSDKPASAAQCPMIYRGYNRLYLISTHRLSSLLHYYQYIIFIIIFSYLFTWYWRCCLSLCKFFWVKYFVNISPSYPYIPNLKLANKQTVV